MSVIINPYSVQPGTAQNLKQIITALGLTSGLEVCLDAGEGDSYTSGSKWLDLSGNGEDFYRGTSSAGDAAEPTFNGVADALSASNYWSFDGGDYFLYDAANETWMESMHKDNATFSWAIWWYPVITGSAQALFSTFTAATSIGFSFQLGSSGTYLTQVGNGTGSFAFNSGGQGTPVDQTWSFIGGSVNEATPLRRYVANGSVVSESTGWSSPSASAATNPFKIGILGNAGTAPIANGGRVACAAFWSTDIGDAALRNIWAATRGRFGV